MTPIGNQIGTALTKSRKLLLILIVSFVLGLAITISEPDLQVLAETVPHIDNMVLLLTVGVGVGFFLAVAMLRILTGVKLRWFLIAFYAVVFVLAAFTDNSFLGVAFDSGGVTTGPMTVPFILALGVGVSHIRSDRSAEADSFGLVSLCSIGPILSVLILGFFYPSEGASVDVAVSTYADDDGDRQGISDGDPCLYEGNGSGHAADCGDLFPVPGSDAADRQAQTGKNLYGFCLYICGAGTVPHRP